MGQVKLSMVKYLLANYLSLSKIAISTPLLNSYPRSAHITEVIEPTANYTIFNNLFAPTESSSQLERWRFDGHWTIDYAAADRNRPDGDEISMQLSNSPSGSTLFDKLLSHGILVRKLLKDLKLLPQ